MIHINTLNNWYVHLDDHEFEVTGDSVVQSIKALQEEKDNLEKYANAMEQVVASDVESGPGGFIMSQMKMNL